MQSQFVNPVLQRNVIPELALPARAIEPWVQRPTHMLYRILYRRPTAEAGIRAPELSGMVDKASRSSRQDPDFRSSRRANVRVANLRLYPRHRLFGRGILPRIARHHCVSGPA